MGTLRQDSGLLLRVLTYVFYLLGPSSHSHPVSIMWWWGSHLCISGEPKPVGKTWHHAWNLLRALKIFSASAFKNLTSPYFVGFWLRNSISVKCALWSQAGSEECKISLLKSVPLWDAYAAEDRNRWRLGAVWLAEDRGRADVEILLSRRGCCSAPPAVCPRSAGICWCQSSSCSGPGSVTFHVASHPGMRSEIKKFQPEPPGAPKWKDVSCVQL